MVIWDMGINRFPMMMIIMIMMMMMMILYHGGQGSRVHRPFTSIPLNSGVRLVIMMMIIRMMLKMSIYVWLG